MSSCSSTEDKVFLDQVSPDLAETFNIENKKFAKFIVESRETPQRSNQTKPKKIARKAKPERQNIPVKKVININKQKDVEVITIEPKRVPIEKQTLPEDYPEELLSLDIDSEKTWKNYSPFYKVGEEFLFSINYLGLTAGRIRFVTTGNLKIADRNAIHFRALFKTSKFYKYIYEADDMVETYVSADNFLPIKYSLVQRESNKDVDDLQLFDREEKKTYLFYKRLKKKNNEIRNIEKEAYIPKYYQDFMSTLFFVRGLPLKKGDVYKFPVFTRGKFWRLTVTVSSIDDQIKALGVWKKAIRLDTVALPPKSDKKKQKSTISFWYSNDADRIFLKLKAKLKFGSIEGEIEEHIPGRLP
jgi:hypothetical protein